jgi:hypothetical protein
VAPNIFTWRAQQMIDLGAGIGDAPNGCINGLEI